MAALFYSSPPLELFFLLNYIRKLTTESRRTGLGIKWSDGLSSSLFSISYDGNIHIFKRFEYCLNLITLYIVFQMVLMVTSLIRHTKN